MVERAQPRRSDAEVRERELGLAAHRTRLALYAAAGLDTGDDVPAPDDRFDRARRILGPASPAVAAAVEARNALAATAAPIVRAVARAYSERVPALLREDAQQSGSEGAQRAAELYQPSAGSWRSYARKWIVKRVSAAADNCRAVRIGERARLAGGRVEVVEVDHRMHAEHDAERIEAMVSAEAEVARLDEAMDRLAPLERSCLALAHGLDGRDPLPPRAAAAAMGLALTSYTSVLRRALERLRADLTGAEDQPPQLALFGS